MNAICSATCKYLKKNRSSSKVPFERRFTDDLRAPGAGGQGCSERSWRGSRRCADISLCLFQVRVGFDDRGRKGWYLLFEVAQESRYDLRMNVGYIVAFGGIADDVVEFGMLQPCASSGAGGAVVDVDLAFGSLGDAQLPFLISDAMHVESTVSHGTEVEPRLPLERLSGLLKI